MKGYTTVPQMSSWLLRTLLALVYHPSTALRPHPFRSHPPKSVAGGTTRSTTIALQSLRLGCSDSAPLGKNN